MVFVVNLKGGPSVILFRCYGPEWTGKAIDRLSQTLTISTFIMSRIVSANAVSIF